MIIRTPDYHLRVFVSSTLKELAEERKAIRQAILKLRLSPVMFESGARPHPAQQLYKSYLSQSQIFIGIYWQSYGWIAPDMGISGLEDEYNLSSHMPRLIYIKNPAPDREPALTKLLDRIRDDNSSCYTYFSTPAELKTLVQDDLALMLSERFEGIEHNLQSSLEPKHIPQTNLPIPRNSLIGREQELAKVHNLLLQDDIALVTLTGAGGTGKSRLALQIGLEMLDHFKDGVYLVRLELINEPNQVISTIAETLGIHQATSSLPVADMLKQFLHDKQMLLLLDNFEQVVAAAPDVADLLEACPIVKIIVTSRTPLRLRSEKELPVSPLTVPSLEKLIELNSLSQYAAVELFIQRAQAVRPDFSITNTNAAAVAEICYRLDGLPLAIELAAARIKILSPQELLSRMGNRFDLLRSGMRDLPERQKTLRGAIDWSYNLLKEPERKLFRRLSIFKGTWTLKAAETVCDLNGDLSIEVDDALVSLIDNSLVFQIPEDEEEWRFGMLTTIHEYAFERLNESDEADAVHLQHAQYYLDFVEKVEPRIRSSERVRWLRVMQNEFGNIRAVLDWICKTGNCLALGQEIVCTLGTFWVTSGYSAEGSLWCAQIMSVTDESTHIGIRARLLCVAAWMAWALGEHTSAQGSAEESLELFRSIDNFDLENKNGFAIALLIGGMLVATSHDLVRATALYQESIDLFRETKDLWYEAIALSWLGDVTMYSADREQAMNLKNLSTKLAREQGDPWCLIPSLLSTAHWVLLDGDLTKARSLLIEAVNLLRITGDRWSLSWALNDLGHIAILEGDPDQASIFLLEALSIAKTMGNRRVLLIIITGVAALIAIRLNGSLNVQSDQHQHKLSEAGRLCGATMPYVQMPGIFVWPATRMLYDEDITRVKTILGDGLWEKAYSQGQNISFEHAITLATQSLRDQDILDID